MRVCDVIRAPKEGVAAGPWRAGKVPAAEFQMRPAQPPVRNPSTWWWRILAFAAHGVGCRVLIQLHEPKETCRLTLGVTAPDGFLRIVCVHEFHPQEPGWHCHAVYACADGVPHWNHRGLRKWPKPPKPGASFGVDRRGATARAVQFFRLEVPGVLL